MPCLLTSNNKSPCLPINNNKDIEKTVWKQSLLYYSATKAPNVGDPLTFGLSTVDIRSRKSKCTTSNKKSQTRTINVATKKQNNNDLFIPIALTKIGHSCKSKRTNIKNDDKKQDGISTYIRTIGCQSLQKNRKIVTKNDFDKSERDEMSDAIDEDIKKKELRTSNSSIKVHIPCLSIWLNSSALNSIK